MATMTAQNKADVALYERALEAGAAALVEATPTPMVVGEAASLFSDEFKPGAKTYFVEGGVCGFAWVNLKSKGGGMKFINSLVKVGLAKKGEDRYSDGFNNTARFRKDSYYGGYTFWVSEGGQSMERKEAFARAFAGVLTETGLTAYARSRMD